MSRILLVAALFSAAACAPKIYAPKSDGVSTGGEVPRDRVGEPILSAVKPVVDVRLQRPSAPRD